MRTIDKSDSYSCQGYLNQAQYFLISCVDQAAVITLPIEASVRPGGPGGITELFQGVSNNGRALQPGYPFPLLSASPAISY